MNAIVVFLFGIYLARLSFAANRAKILLITTLFEDEAAIEFARFGSDHTLSCNDDQNTIWEVDEVRVDQMDGTKFMKNKNGSLIIPKINFDDALKKFSCRQFFTEDDLVKYKENKTTVAPYRTSVTTMPVIVYKPEKKTSSTCVIETASWKNLNSSRFCYIVDGTVKGHCQMLGVNSSFEITVASNFIFFIDKERFFTDRCSDETEQPVTGKFQLLSVSLAIGLAVGIGLAVVVVLIVGLCCCYWRCRRNKKRGSAKQQKNKENAEAEEMMNKKNAEAEEMMDLSD